MVCCLSITNGRNFNVTGNDFNRYDATWRIYGLLCPFLINRASSITINFHVTILLVCFVVNPSPNDCLQRIDSASGLAILFTRFLRRIYRTINCFAKCSNIGLVGCSDQRFRNSNGRYFSERRSAHCFASQDSKEGILRRAILINEGRRTSDVFSLWSKFFLWPRFRLRASVQRSRQCRPNYRLFFCLAHDHYANFNRRFHLLLSLFVLFFLAFYRFNGTLVMEDSVKRLTAVFLHRDGRLLGYLRAIFLLRKVSRIRAIIRLVRPYEVRLSELALQECLLQGVFRFSVNAFRAFNGFLNELVGSLRIVRHVRAILWVKGRSSFIQDGELFRPVGPHLSLLHVAWRFDLLFRFLLLSFNGVDFFGLLRLGASVVFVNATFLDRFRWLKRLSFDLFPPNVAEIVFLRYHVVVYGGIRRVRLGPFLVRRRILVLQVCVGRLFTRLFCLRREYKDVVGGYSTFAKYLRFATRSTLLVVFRLILLGRQTRAVH